VTEEMVSGTADQLEFMMIEGHVPLEEAWKPVYDAFKRLRSQGDAGHNFKDYAIIDLEFSVYQHGSHGLAEIWQVSVIDLLGRPIAEDDRISYKSAQHRLNKLPTCATSDRDKI
jgi:hypothetical protein